MSEREKKFSRVWKKFSRAWKRYERARTLAWDAFDAIEGPAWTEYENAIRYHDTELIPNAKDTPNAPPSRPRTPR